MRNLRRGILWDPDAWQDYLDWRSTEPENVEKINTFIRECLRALPSRAPASPSR